MKLKYIIKYLCCIVAFLLISFKITAQSASTKMLISITSGKIKINRKNINNDWKTSEFITILDTGYRKKAGKVNDIYTYDKLGITLFEPIKEKIGTGKISEIQFFLGAEESKSTNPEAFYAGKIVLQQLNINQLTTIDELRNNLKDYTETMLDEYDKYRFSKNGLYLFFIYNKAKKIVKLTVGLEKNKRF